MSPKPLTKRLADLHEEDMVALFGGRKTKSSGNQSNDQGDGRHHPYDPIGMAWDCKCAMPETKSISITRDMLRKATEEAHLLSPAIPLRFYATERGEVELDWIAVPTHYLKALHEMIHDLMRSD